MEQARDEQLVRQRVGGAEAQRCPEDTETWDPEEAIVRHTQDVRKPRESTFQQQSGGAGERRAGETVEAKPSPLFNEKVRK